VVQVRTLLTVAGLAIALDGCAGGLPWTATRAYYHFCMHERNDQTYCEAWAPMKAHESGSQPQPNAVFIQPLPPPR
jgi:hypothetical protein